MTAPDTTSPTSLLWAHQLKRQHGHLLQRIQNLENKSKDQDTRITQAAETLAEANSTRNDTLDTLTDKVQAISDSRRAIESRVRDMETSRTETLDSAKVASEQTQKQITALSNAQNQTQQTLAKTAESHESLLQRITDLEVGLKEYAESLGQLGKRVDVSGFEKVMVRLKALEEQVRRGEEQRDDGDLPRSIKAIEGAQAEVRRAFEKNRVVAERQSRGGGNANGNASPATAAVTSAPGTKAVRDQLQRAMVRDEQSSQIPGLQSSKVVGGSPLRIANSKRKRSVDNGGRSGSITSTAVSPNALHPPTATTAKALPMTDDELARQKLGPNAVVTGKGKGWIETVSPMVPSEPPAKRKRGRPRKEDITPEGTAEQATFLQGRQTRRKQYEPHKQRAFDSQLGSKAAEKPRSTSDAVTEDGDMAESLEDKSPENKPHQDPRLDTVEGAARPTGLEDVNSHQQAASALHDASTTRHSTTAPYKRRQPLNGDLQAWRERWNP